MLVDEYVAAVKDGSRIAGDLEKWAVQRYLDDLERCRQPGSLWYFSESLAEMPCRFFGLLTHTDGEYSGQPFILKPWQAFIIFNLFGFRRRDTRCRRYREAFLSVARGNGKTPFAAAIMLYLLCLDYPMEDRAEVYAAAVKRDQASLAFNAAKRFVEQSEGLREWVRVLSYSLCVAENGSVFKPLSSDGKTADGLNIHGVVRDEVHSWADHQREYYSKLQTALGKRRQPLAITITTAGSEESTLWREQHGHARRVVDPHSPTREDSLFVFICEIDEEDDELDPDVWPKANPMLEYGIVKREYLEDMAARGADDLAARHEFRRFHANKFSFSFNKSFSSQDWQKGDEPLPESMSSVVYAGVDLGWLDDLAAIGYVAPLDWVSIEGESKRRYAIFCDAFCPRGTRRQLNRPPFLQLVKSGRLYVTNSEWTDTEPMYAAIKKRRKQFGIKSLAFDPNNAREFALNCENSLGLKTFAFQQTHAKYNEPLKEFKVALAEGRIVHGGDPLLAWAALNTVEEENSKGHRMPSKGRSEDKIDPFVAVLMAFSECLFAERRKPSVYETRGPIVVG